MKWDFCKVFSYYLMLVSMITFFMGMLFMLNDKGYYIDWEVLSYLGCDFSMNFVVDWMSLIFTSFVSFVSSCVMYYSVSYMEGDSTKNRFALLVFLFVISMFLLINSGNLVSLLLGWDGLGLVSYCLVIYYHNLRSYNAGMITVLSNRIGDASLLMAICWMMICGDWSYDFIYGKDFNIMILVLLFCILSAMTKSAQIPFSAWLPAAMAAPTPVSALVHSSTLVTAGVYLMIRLGSFYDNCAYPYKILLLLSVLTMFMAGLSANYEYDLKKIIALSTLSQLGLMMFILSVGYTSLAYYHLLTHAMFKALLFLCAGAYIHSYGDSQDIRYMGSLIYSTPFISMMMVVANMALFGFPFLAGFYSKDGLVEMYMGGEMGMLMIFILMVSIGLTSCYSMRLSYYLLWGNMSSKTYVVIGDSDSKMIYPMIMLGIMAIVGGSMLMWLLFPSPLSCVISGFEKLLVLLLVLMGIWWGMMIWWGKSYNKSGLFSFFGTMWFTMSLSGQWVSFMWMKYGIKLIEMGDMGWVEYVGGQGMYKNITFYGFIVQWWQNNSLKIYLFLFFVVVLGYLII